MDSMPAASYQYINVVPYSNLMNWSVNYHLERDHGYNEEYELVNIGSVISRNREKVELQEEELYTQVTIRLWGKGVVERTKKYGKEIGTKNQYRVSEGQFIMSKIDARNGALGIVPAELEGAITTQDFLSYNINTDKAHPKFLKILSTTDQFLKICQSASTGTTGRRRIDEKFFLSIPIPLPSLDEQEEIVRIYNQRICLADQKQNESKEIRDDIFRSFLKSIGVKLISEFSKPITTVSFLRFIKYSELNSWTVRNNRVSDKFDFENVNLEIVPLGVVFTKFETGKTPSKSRLDFWQNGTINWVSPKDFQGLEISSSEDKITEMALSNNNQKIYKPGVLLCVFRSGILRHSFPIAKTTIPTTINQDLKVIDVDPEKVHIDYLHYYLHFLQDFVLEKASKVGVTVESINSKEFLELPLVLPSLDHQAHIIKNVQSGLNKSKVAQYKASDLRISAKTEIEKQIFKS